MSVKLTGLMGLWVVLLLTSAFAMAEDEAIEVDEKVYYYEMEPPFVANYGTSSKKLKFLKATVSLRTVGSGTQNVLFSHNALLRHTIVMLLSRQTEESIASQEAVRQDALKAVQEALKEEIGEAIVEDLLFTTFVVQR